MTDTPNHEADRDRGGAGGAGDSGAAAGGVSGGEVCDAGGDSLRQVPEDVLARLVEEIDDTNALLEGVRRRGVPPDLTRGLYPPVPNRIRHRRA